MSEGKNEFEEELTSKDEMLDTTARRNHYQGYRNV